MFKLISRSEIDSADVLTVKETLKAYFSGKSTATEKTYQTHLGIFSSFLNLEKIDQGLLQASRRDVIRFYNWQIEQTGMKSRDGITNAITSNTVNQRLDCLRRIFNEFKENGLIEENPFPKSLQMHKDVRQKLPTNMVPYEFVDQICDAPGKDLIGLRDRALLAMLFGCGLRVGEIVLLKLEQFDQHNRCFRNVKTKTRNDRSVLLSDSAFKAVVRLIEARKASGVYQDTFIWKNYRNGRRGALGHLNSKTAWRIWKKHVGSTGLDPEQYSPHSARATCITKLLDDGLSHREVKNFSGHASVLMVERYDKARQEVKDDPAKYLDFRSEKG